MSITIRFFDPLILYPGSIEVQKLVEKEEGVSQGFSNTVEKARLAFDQNFQAAKQELLTLTAFFTFKQIHQFHRIFEIYLLFLKELKTFQSQEFPDHENNVKFEKLLSEFEVAYSLFRDASVVTPEGIKKLKVYNQLFVRLLLDSSLKDKIEKSLSIFISILSKENVGDLYLKVFFEPQLQSVNWQPLSSFHTKGSKKTYDNLRKVVDSPLEVPLALIETVYQNRVELLAAQLNKAKLMIVQFNQYVKNFFKNCSGKEKFAGAFSQMQKEWSGWDQKKGKFFLNGFSEGLLFCAKYPSIPRDGTLFTACNEAEKYKNLLGAVGIWDFGIPLVCTSYEERICLQEADRAITLENSKMANYVDTFVVSGFMKIFRMLEPFLSSGKNPNAASNLKILQSEEKGDPFMAYAPLDLARTPEPKLTPESDVPVRKKKHTKQIVSPVVQPLVVEEVKEIRVPNDEVPPLLSQSISLCKTSEVVLVLFQTVCSAKTDQARQHYRQMHWHFLQLSALEKNLQEKTSSPSLVHYLSAVTHAGWTIEQALHAQLGEEPAVDPHNLKKLANQVHVNVTPLLKRLYLTNHWERYFLNYDHFYSSSTFFHKKGTELPKVLSTIVTLSQLKPTLKAEQVKEKIILLIEETKEWVYEYLHDKASSAFQEITPQEETSFQFVTHVAVTPLTELKNVFDQAFLRSSPFSQLTYRQLRILFSILEETVTQGNACSKGEQAVFWRVQMIRSCQNLLASLLEEIYVYQTGNKSPYLHQIPVLAKECGLDGWQADVFEGLSIYSRYPLQNSPAGLGCQLINQLESLARYPEQLDHFTPVFNKQDPWTLEPADGKKCEEWLSQFWKETLKGLDLSIHFFDVT